MHTDNKSQTASDPHQPTNAQNAAGNSVDELIQSDAMFYTVEMALMPPDGMDLEREDIEAIQTTLRFARERLGKCIEQLQLLAMPAA